MPELKLSQPERRSFLIPILVAVGALALAVAIATHFFPATTVNLDHVHTDVVPTHTVFESHSIVLNSKQTQDVLFIVETLKVDNQLRTNIFLDDFELTLTNPDGRQLTVKALQKGDLSNVETTFPQLKPLLTSPLLRETSLEPGKAAQGSVLFSLPMTPDMWNARQTGIVKVDLYHQPSLYVTLPKAPSTPKS